MIKMLLLVVATGLLGVMWACHKYALTPAQNELISKPSEASGKVITLKGRLRVNVEIASLELPGEPNVDKSIWIDIRSIGNPKLIRPSFVGETVHIRGQFEFSETPRFGYLQQWKMRFKTIEACERAGE